MIEYLKALLISIVEGITEWLPVSSTGHMILVNEFVNLKFSDSFKDLFFTIIQAGAFLAVILRYFNYLFPFNPKLTNKQKKDVWELLIKIIISCIPCGVVGILLDDLIPDSPIIISIALIVYGVLFLLIERYYKKKQRVRKLKELTYLDALKIGLFQVLAIIPGTSRSGSTILGALLLGISRSVAVEFSFLAALPVVYGQAFLKIIKYGLALTFTEIGILIFGIVATFITSVLVIRFILDYIKSNSFKVFGFYRIILGYIILGYFLLIK